MKLTITIDLDKPIFQAHTLEPAAFSIPIARALRTWANELPANLYLTAGMKRPVELDNSTVGQAEVTP